MKKFLKIMLCIMGSLLAVIVAFWFSISYLILIRLSTCEVRCFCAKAREYEKISVNKILL